MLIAFMKSNGSFDEEATKTNDDQATIVNYGTLTLSNGSDTGGVYAAGKYTGALFNKPGATATLQNVKLQDYAEDTVSAGWYIVQNLGNMTFNSGVDVAAVNPQVFSDSIIINGVDHQYSGDQWNGDAGGKATALMGASQSNAVLTINDGTYTGGHFCIKNGDWFAEMTINGGTFTAAKETGYYKGCTLSNANNCTCTVNDGTFTAKGETPVVKCKNKTEFIGKNGTVGNGLTIKNGTFTSEGTSDVLESLSKSTAPAPVLNIEGGKFRGSYNATSEAKDGNYTVVSTAFRISGGLYSADPSAYVVSGQSAIGSGDTTYPYKIGRMPIVLSWTSSKVYNANAQTPTAEPSGIDPSDVGKVHGQSAHRTMRFSRCSR